MSFLFMGNLAATRDLIPDLEQFCAHLAVPDFKRAVSHYSADVSPTIDQSNVFTVLDAAISRSDANVIAACFEL